MEQEKFSWKQMTWKQRWQYFMDYYFKITLVAVILLCMAISFIKTVFFDRKKTMLSVMVLNENMDFDQETMEQELREKMGWTQKDQEVSFTFLSTGSYENDVVLVTRLQARSVDVMIADRETFDSYMKKGFFDEAQKYLPEGSDQETVLIRGCTEEVDDTGKVISKGEERAYGFDLSTSEKYRELGGMLEDPVLGIVVNGEHLDAANSLIEYLTE